MSCSEFCVFWLVGYIAYYASYLFLLMGCSVAGALSTPTAMGSADNPSEVKPTLLTVYRICQCPLKVQFILRILVSVLWLTWMIIGVVRSLEFIDPLNPKYRGPDPAAYSDGTSTLCQAESLLWLILVSTMCTLLNGAIELLAKACLKDPIDPHAKTANGQVSSLDVSGVLCGCCLSSGRPSKWSNDM